MANHSRFVDKQFAVYKDEGPLSKISGIKIPSGPIYHEKEVLVLPPNHTPKTVEQYDYSTVKHFGGYDVHGAVKGAAQVAATKTKTAMKAMNIPDTDQHYAHVHLVYSKNYANYV